MDIEWYDKKLEKFIKRLDELIAVLHRERMNYCIRQKIDDFYYMQKIAELNFLKEHLWLSAMKQEAVVSIIETEYKNVFCRWKKEARWLNQFLLFEKKKGISIL